jgi:hypothetical protein
MHGTSDRAVDDAATTEVRAAVRTDRAQRTCLTSRVAEQRERPIENAPANDARSGQLGA